MVGQGVVLVKKSVYHPLMALRSELWAPTSFFLALNGRPNYPAVCPSQCTASECSVAGSSFAKAEGARARGDPSTAIEAAKTGSSADADEKKLRRAAPAGARGTGGASARQEVMQRDVGADGEVRKAEGG